MNISRRTFLASCTMATTTACMASWPVSAKNSLTTFAGGTFQLSLTAHTAEPDIELLRAVSRAGISDIWVTGFVCGQWWCGPERMKVWQKHIQACGMNMHVLNMPLGHPDFKLPPHWTPGISPEGKSYYGTSIHHPVTKENCEALQKIAALNVKRVFLDDDFRLARGPGVIGGCFCPKHKQDFLQRTGYGEAHWQDLLAAITSRSLTPVLRDWIDFNCDQLSECFRAQQQAVPGVELGIMIMYLGSEKAGIRLTDYRDMPLRVGEFKFDDESFTPIKGKTDELFSSLFHRRFVRPELAYSETTAFPPHKLSLKNKVAKLAVPTISDVRNTMFMCDYDAKEEWPTFARAIQQHRDIRPKIAGHVLRGPLKHFWGEASRYISDDNPYSLFLALGIPFEVTEQLSNDGFTFLSDADASAIGKAPSVGTTLIARPGKTRIPEIRIIPESLPDLYAFKKQILAQLKQVPYIEDEIPVVCAWYPTAHAVLLWNLTEQHQNLTLCYGTLRRNISIGPLDVALVEEVVAK